MIHKIAARRQFRPKPGESFPQSQEAEEEEEFMRVHQGAKRQKLPKKKKR